ncbi:MAG: helix-turn-helix domain-containing protein [Acidaminococcus sp.]|jgi:excisionase family DNA binding protein|nr:helix-turn-helix domain-containing protein [Acidaminococcus sp.]
MEKQERKFWTPEQVRIEIFNKEISKSTLLNLIHDGAIPAMRVGRRIYIPAYWVKQKIEFADGQMNIKEGIV